jgi:hypothetical protein
MELLKNLRYKIAYRIAPDWIGDLEYRLSCLLCEATGGRLSKEYYPVQTMLTAVIDYQNEREDEAKADTVRKMQEMLNQVFGGMDATNALLRRTFDQVAKEMLEDV